MELQIALYLIPVPISEAPLMEVLPTVNFDIVRELKYFIVENIRTARRFLKKAWPDIDISQLTFYELNGHTPENEITGYLEALRRGNPIGVMSEAGCPGVADPGAAVVSIAQAEGLKVVPLIGPSSILLSLMASGFNGQKFSFQGYLPVDNKERERTIKELETFSERYDMTQIFIETPYRNEKMMESLVHTLKPETLLCVASNVTSAAGEMIVSKPVKQWRKETIKLEKVPTVFLFYCGNFRKKK